MPGPPDVVTPHAACTPPTLYGCAGKRPTAILDVTLLNLNSADFTFPRLTWITLQRWLGVTTTIPQADLTTRWLVRTTPALVPRTTKPVLGRFISFVPGIA